MAAVETLVAMAADDGAANATKTEKTVITVLTLLNPLAGLAASLAVFLHARFRKSPAGQQTWCNLWALVGSDVADKAWNVFGKTIAGSMSNRMRVGIFAILAESIFGGGTVWETLRSGADGLNTPYADLPEVLSMSCDMESGDLTLGAMGVMDPGFFEGLAVGGKVGTSVNDPTTATPKRIDASKAGMRPEGSGSAVVLDTDKTSVGKLLSLALLAAGAALLIFG